MLGSSGLVLWREDRQCYSYLLESFYLRFNSRELAILELDSQHSSSPHGSLNLKGLQTLLRLKWIEVCLYSVPCWRSACKHSRVCRLGYIDGIRMELSSHALVHHFSPSVLTVHAYMPHIISQDPWNCTWI